MQTGHELISEELNKFHSITERLYPKVSKSQVEVIQKCDSSFIGYSAEYLFLTSTLLQYNTPIANEPESNVEERLNKFDNSRESMIKDCKL
jgi:Pyruvate/2-oxoacid:ferredoxin oxidoreductase gamma subunit